MNIDNKEVKMQYILNENGELAEIPKDQCKSVEHPVRYKLKNAFEVFVLINDTDNYWISNYGRCVNNYLSRKFRRKPKEDKFHLHKEGKCHYTIYEVDRADGSTYGRNTSPEELVAETFLSKYKGRLKIWHKDGDENNNWYKNLIYVNRKDYADLKAGNVTWQELNIEQEYIEYENKATTQACVVYNGILARCKGDDSKNNVHECYNQSVMCQEWMDNPKSFVKWYLLHYYECDDEQMDVDKDLFGDGSGMYCPDFCCILPKGLNTMLTNCKKSYFEGQTKANVLPLGVRYNSKKNKYYGEITFSGAENSVTLSEYDTPEEAFEEYKRMKQADILLVSAKYKQKIPDYIYKKLLQVEVNPY